MAAAVVTGLVANVPPSPDCGEPGHRWVPPELVVPLLRGRLMRPCADPPYRTKYTPLTAPMTTAGTMAAAAAAMSSALPSVGFRRSRRGCHEQAWRRHHSGGRAKRRSRDGGDHHRASRHRNVAQLAVAGDGGRRGSAPAIAAASGHQGWSEAGGGRSSSDRDQSAHLPYLRWEGAAASTRGGGHGHPPPGPDLALAVAGRVNSESSSGRRQRLQRQQGLWRQRW